MFAFFTQLFRLVSMALACPELSMCLVVLTPAVLASGRVPILPLRPFHIDPDSQTEKDQNLESVEIGFS